MLLKRFVIPAGFRMASKSPFLVDSAPAELVAHAMSAPETLPRVLSRLLRAILGAPVAPRLSDPPMVALRRLARQTSECMVLLSSILDASLKGDSCPECLSRRRRAVGATAFPDIEALHTAIIHSPAGLGRVGAVCAFGTGSVAASASLFARFFVNVAELAVGGATPAGGEELAFAHFIEWLTAASLAPGWAGSKLPLLSSLLGAVDVSVAKATPPLEGRKPCVPPGEGCDDVLRSVLGSGSCIAGLLACLVAVVQVGGDDAGSLVLRWVCEHVTLTAAAVKSSLSMPHAAVATRAARRGALVLHAGAFMCLHGLPQPLPSEQVRALAAAFATWDVDTTSSEKFALGIDSLMFSRALAVHYANMLAVAGPPVLAVPAAQLPLRCSCPLAKHVIYQLICSCGSCDQETSSGKPVEGQDCGGFTRLDCVPCLRALARRIVAPCKAHGSPCCDSDDSMPLLGLVTKRLESRATKCRVLNSLRRPGRAGGEGFGLAALPEPVLAHVAAFAAGGRPADYASLACVCRELRDAVASDDERWKAWFESSFAAKVIAIEDVASTPSSRSRPAVLLCACESREHAPAQDTSANAPGRWRRFFLARRHAFLRIAQTRTKMLLRKQQLVGGGGASGRKKSALPAAVMSCPLCSCSDPLPVDRALIGDHLVQRHGLGDALARAVAQRFA